jgi:hypothetical protein
MKKGGGKGKGSAFERKVCVLLSLWVTNGKKKDAFWRSSMSGGRATIHVKRGDKNRQAGDITAVAPEGHQFTDVFFAECKHVRNLDIASFFTKGIGRLAKFWAQAKKQAAQHDRRAGGLGLSSSSRAGLHARRDVEGFTCEIQGSECPGNGVYVASKIGGGTVIAPLSK